MTTLSTPIEPAALVHLVERDLQPVWERLEPIRHRNQEKVLDAFIQVGIGEQHFAGTTGYGHGDLGREALDEVFALLMGAEAALVRSQFASGTHAIAVALFGALRPGDELLYVTGHPYDTLEEVIGLREPGQGSLMEWGVSYREIDLTPEGRLDLEAIATGLKPETRVVAFQRSRGYSWRPSIDLEQLREAIARVRAVRPDVTVLVDNCYGEFTETLEPCDVGADLVAGSLIKNPGGGIVPMGGYVAGRKDLVERAACRLTAPGIGREGGATLDANRLLFQGLFLAPHVVIEAMKAATLAAACFQRLGYEVDPLPDALRTDIIQAIRFGEPTALVGFCEAIQLASPVHAYVKPIPDVVPGYEDRVVMAGGTFIEGSTIELSADGPLREPYVAYYQGGLTYSHARIALMRAIHRIQEANR
ncbi:MAG: methionine gamma-lyase family protein [bacterium]|nr:methionine gamma-lyase family protein [bacterium]